MRKRDRSPYRVVYSDGHAERTACYHGCMSPSKGPAMASSSKLRTLVGIVAALFLAIALTGCSSAGNDTASTEQDAASQTETASQAQTAEQSSANGSDESTDTEGTDMQPSSEFMQIAIDEAYQGIQAGDGGPFGSVIVKDGEIVGRGHNRVLANNDPTCHGEMEAIRDACRNLGTHDLTGCELYTTAEPCPMCLGAVLWSNMDAVYYGCTREDSAEIGFRDDAFYRQLNGEEETVSLQEFDRDTCRQLFDDYAAGDAQRY